MQILNQLETEPLPIEEEEKRHTRRLLVGVVCALFFAGLLLGGFLLLLKWNDRKLAAAAADVENQKKNPKVEVFVDDTMVDGKKATLGGTLHNISKDTLHGLAVELQLRKRIGGGVETRLVAPESRDLGPDAVTRYSLDVPVSDYISSTFMRVVSGENRAAVPSKALPGAERPPMDVPASKTVTVSRPTPKGEEFINTPNTPGKVP